MSNSSAYWAALHQKQAELDKLFSGGFLHTMSIENLNAGSVAGVVSQVSTRIAARDICENVARIATPNEVAEFQARSAAFAVRMATQKFNRQKSETSGVTITLTK